VNLRDLTKKLKNKLACGGTLKDGRIELQGKHKARLKEVLVEMGFSPEMIKTS
jgi:translation initiation factor 1